jgi:hypothetical protein
MANIKATNLKFHGYPGHVMLQKIRYGYGNQSHEEKMDILHNWYSDLNAYLPVISGQKTKLTDEDISKIIDYMIKAKTSIDEMEQSYEPTFEGMQTCTPQEKNFRAILRRVKENLDNATAISKIIDDQQTTEETGWNV